MSNFQTILVAIFLAAFVFGVLIFSGALKIGEGKKSSDGITGKIVIWGTLPEKDIASSFSELSNPDGTYTVSYVEKAKESFNQELIEAIAKDQAPDIFILPTDLLLSNYNFAYKIPFSYFPERDFKDLYIDGAQILLSKDGVLGYPLIVDPIVMYYNKNMLSNESILYPPKYWDEVFDLSNRLIKIKDNGSIEKAMIALGQYENINNSKEIISSLLLQTGNKIVEKSDTVPYRVSINDNDPNKPNTFTQIINFFLEFSNPSKESYTWSRSLPNSSEMFIGDKLAFYLGFGSELFRIKSLNPNLSFDITSIPQVKNSDIKATYGNIYTMVLNKKSKNLNSAFGIANIINNDEFLKSLSVQMSLPTAKRSLLAVPQEQSYLSTLFDSTIISRSWLDPDFNKSNDVFRELIQNSLSNKLQVGQAIQKASSQLEMLMNKIYE